MGEHLPCKQGVRGSNPLISTPKISSVTHLENRIYDNLAEHERKLKSGSLCTRRIGSRRSKKLRQDIDRGVIIKVTRDQAAGKDRRTYGKDRREF